MQNYNAQIKTIKEQVKKLVLSYGLLKQERDKLAEQNEVLTREAAERDKKMEEFQNKNINLQLSRALGKGIAGDTHLKQRLDEYIGEIEETIAHLKE